MLKVVVILFESITILITNKITNSYKYNKNFINIRFRIGVIIQY